MLAFFQFKVPKLENILGIQKPVLKIPAGYLTIILLSKPSIAVFSDDGIDRIPENFRH